MKKYFLEFLLCKWQSFKKWVYTYRSTPYYSNVGNRVLAKIRKQIKQIKQIYWRKWSCGFLAFTLIKPICQIFQ